jgi:hypothetical protein
MFYKYSILFQSIFLDIFKGGINNDTVWYGEFPVAASLIMLAVDFVLYGLLALYLDNVIPGNYGWFMPSHVVVVLLGKYDFVCAKQQC